MNRRSFLQLLGLGAAGAVVAAHIPATTGRRSPNAPSWDSMTVKLPLPEKFIIDPNCPPDRIYFMPKPQIIDYRNFRGERFARYIELNANQIGVIKNLR